ncbi:MAG: DUF4910 domain-containing protein, partial [Candidatus Omnitrophica bacterium]|nr:DUF4910 domain-containing protein [Candidatus Omnitrophota bacterium]
MKTIDIEDLPWQELTRSADELFAELFPVCRSLTGEGVRQTLRRLAGVTPFELREVPSGTACFDWVVPDEWNIKGAYIKNSRGETIVDFARNNVHVVSYSVPVNTTMSFAELDPHLHYLPNLPQAIPYRTSYYNRDWGFCLSHDQYVTLDKEDTYRVVIDASLSPGSLTYGEAFIPGDSGKEFLVSTYCCHPSLANDNLSGPILWTLLLKVLRSRKTRHSYRFIIIPEKIGALAYLSHHEQAMKKVYGGFVITTVAGPGEPGYKGSFQGDHLVDRAVRQAFVDADKAYVAYPFDINGSDETQYSSPHFRIPTGTITKDKYYEYDYYHTSLDDLDFVKAAYLIDTLKMYLLTIENLELDLTYRSLNPCGSPMLGKRGLYPKVGGQIRQKAAAPAHASGVSQA